jgi:hypothetical protein
MSMKSPSPCACCRQLLDMVEDAATKATPIRMALWRVQTRRQLGMLEKFEPLLNEGPEPPESR